MSPLLFFFFFFFSIFFYITRGFHVPVHRYTFCNDSTFFPSTNTALRSNFDSLLSDLSAAANLSSTPGFDKYSTVESPPLYGLYMCRGDVDAATCRDCVAVASAELSKNCSRGKQAAIWYDKCMIRYSNASFSKLANDNPQFFVFNSISGNVTKYDQLVLLQTLNNVANKAASGNSTLKFATEEEKLGDSGTLHVMGQCTPDLSPSDCSKCLHTSFNAMPTTSRGGRTLGYTCNLRFVFYSFYRQVSNSQAPPANSRPANSPSHNNAPAIYKPKRRQYTILITGSVIASIVLLLVGLVLLIHLHQRMRKLKSTPDLTDIVAVEALQMDLNIIRAATQNFSIHNKLGQGGFGSVFKGKLQNGQVIAVKRLSHNSGQGITEFKTEVIIVAKLQHRNLVKLLGFCVSGKERILVYEFLPNSSLDKFLFDSTKRMSLDWEMRFKIICGIAKGLLYLHEDSRLRVIHRDLKSSNILLDEDLNPKISDFGLAKLFGADQTQAFTNSVAGTYGYMAPEYILMGRYSIKSDVYSFGVIVLEMVSGQRNKFLNNSLLEEALLYRAWKLWNEGEALKLVDEILCGNYAKDDVIKCVHIGLLCIQESVTNRPNMTFVVAALRGQSITLPLPSPPNFFNDNNTRSIDNTNNSLVESRPEVSIAETSDITYLEGR